MKRKLSLFTFVSTCLVGVHSFADVMINEFHYDNVSTDTGEAIELVGPVGTDLTDWQIVLYNGNATSLNPYNTVALSGSLNAHDSCVGGQGIQVIEFPSNGIQNGSPDGIALIDPLGSVIEFISYEGEFTPVEGPAAGIPSIDIGVNETNSTPLGFSLQKDAENGQWQAAQENTFGQCNGATTPPPPPPPPTQVTLIHAIQGDGAQVEITDAVIVEAIVVGDFQNDDQLDGFFIQEEDADQDGDPSTSEGIFVYCGSCPTQVAVGDLVSVTGVPSEFNGTSQITASTIEILAQNQLQPSPAIIQLPMPIDANDGVEQSIDAFFESFEGMLVTIAGTSVVSEYYQFGRFGEIVLANGERFRQFTDQSLPSEQGFIDHQTDKATRTIVLDDGSTNQNPPLTTLPLPTLTRDNFFRGGDTINNLTGPLQFAFSKWRIHPVNEWFDYTFTPNNPRPETPQSNLGNLTIASYNVLNYFTTLDENDNLCAPGLNLDCRGADDQQEFDRQQSKLVAALCQLDADIIGLMELENANPSMATTPVEQLVTQVNASCPGYTPLVTGPIGDDAIAVGLMYRQNAVTPLGETAVLDSAEFLDPLNTGQSKNRPALAQTFEHIGSGEQITVVVNHLKSKGSGCGEGDDDTLTGQGNCNGTRTAAAQAMLTWLATNPTQIDTDMQLVMGDLNAYRKEDPIQTFLQAGFVDLVDQFGGEDAYSYVFDGQTGYLDHALASPALSEKVVGVQEWHINADEINLFDYNSEFKPENYLTDLFTPDAFRSSDHDPVIVQILLQEQSTPMCNGIPATIYVDNNGVIVGGLLSGLPFQGTLAGSEDDDVIVGTHSNDIIIAARGDDLVCAGEGDDVVINLDGDAQLFGEAGNDTLIGGRGRDTLSGGSGNDLLIGGQGRDVIDGGPGNDIAAGGPGRDTCSNSERAFSC